MSLKNVLILGDSYSTFKGYIPEGYAFYYSENERPETDVRKVSETWWHQVIEETGSNLVLNNSWSGSTIGYTGYNNVDCSESSSFIYRFKKLCDDGFFEENEINTVFVFGGTNDNWADVPFGEEKYADWKKEDLYKVFPAVSYFLKILKEKLPDAKIYVLINTELKPEVVKCLKSACNHYSLQYIQFENITKNSGHPTIQGMIDIKNKVLEEL